MSNNKPVILGLLSPAVSLLHSGTGDRVLELEMLSLTQHSYLSSFTPGRQGRGMMLQQPTHSLFP